MVATETLKIYNVKRPTFKALLIDDNGVVLRSLCQTEKLASERENEKERRAKIADTIRKYIMKVSLFRQAPCWMKLDYISYTKYITSYVRLTFAKAYITHTHQTLKTLFGELTRQFHVISCISEKWWDKHNTAKMPANVFFIILLFNMRLITKSSEKAQRCSAAYEENLNNWEHVVRYTNTKLPPKNGTWHLDQYSVNNNSIFSCVAA